MTFSLERQTLSGWLSGLLSTRAEAEDVVQETLIRVWNKRDEWTKFGSIEAYCLTVAKNLAIDRSERKDAQIRGTDT